MGLLYDKFLLVLFFTHLTQSQAKQKFSSDSLVTTLQNITDITNSYFTIFDIHNTSIEKVNEMLNKTANTYSSDCNSTSQGTYDRVVICNLPTQVLTVKTWTKVPTYLSLAVHNRRKNLTNPVERIKQVCYEHFPYPKIACAELFERCYANYTLKVCTERERRCLVKRETTTSYESTTSDNKGTYDASKDNCRQSGGIHIVPMIIASIVSFIAGIVACLLVLCLLRHCRKRPCFKSSTSEDGSSKPKQHQETYKGLQAQSKGKNIPEYIGLQDVDPKIRTELGAKRPQPSAPQQAIVYETSDKRRSEHVYSELGNNPTNGPGEYESTYPNRSSNHVYQGIQDNTNPDISSRHQTNELPENKRGNKGHINGAMGQDRDPISETDGADGCYSQKHDYFVLEKENHKPNESEMSAGTKSDGQGRLNDSLQSEPDDNNTQPNDYFVLEKEDKAVNKVERIADIKIDDTHLEADDDVDDDYHSYHVLEKQ